MAAEPHLYSAVRDALRRLPGTYLLQWFDGTPEKYDELLDEDLHCDLIDGVLIVHSPASPNHEDRVSFINAVLRLFAGRHKLGRVFGSNVVMQSGERRLCPDVAFLREEHAGRIHGAGIRGPFDLVVEVLSPSTRVYDREQKAAAYRDAGVPEIWLIDPDLRTFQAWTREDSGYQLHEVASARWSSRVLPGLEFDPAWLWDIPLPDPLTCLGWNGGR